MELHSRYLSFGIDEEVIVISPSTIGLVFPFIDLFGHALIGDKVGIDFIKGLFEAQ